MQGGSARGRRGMGGGKMEMQGAGEACLGAEGMCGGPRAGGESKEGQAGMLGETPGSGGGCRGAGEQEGGSEGLKGVPGCRGML